MRVDGFLLLLLLAAADGLKMIKVMMRGKALALLTDLYLALNFYI